MSAAGSCYPIWPCGGHRTAERFCDVMSRVSLPYRLIRPSRYHRSGAGRAKVPSQRWYCRTVPRRRRVSRSKTAGSHEDPHRVDGFLPRAARAQWCFAGQFVDGPSGRGDPCRGHLLGELSQLGIGGRRFGQREDSPADRCWADVIVSATMSRKSPAVAALTAVSAQLRSRTGTASAPPA